MVVTPGPLLLLLEAADIALMALYLEAWPFACPATACSSDLSLRPLSLISRSLFWVLVLPAVPLKVPLLGRP